MKLKIAHRLMLLQIIPDKGTIDILRIVRDLRGVLSFSEEEHKNTFLRQEGNMYVWGDPEWEEHGYKNVEEAAKAVDGPRDVEIGERAFDVIKSAVNTTSNEGQLTPEFIPFYEHFVERKEWELDASN